MLISFDFYRFVSLCGGRCSRFLEYLYLTSFSLGKRRKSSSLNFLNIRNVSVIIGALLAGPIGMQANLYAVKYIGSSLASSVSAIYPAISVLLAFFFLKHKISKNTVFGWDCLDYCSDL